MIPVTEIAIETYYLTAKEPVIFRVDIVMSNEKGVVRFFKWHGIVAMIAFPITLFLKWRKPDPLPESHPDEDSNIFAAELEE